VYFEEKIKDTWPSLKNATLIHYTCTCTTYELSLMIIISVFVAMWTH